MFLFNHSVVFVRMCMDWRAYVMVLCGYYLFQTFLDAARDLYKETGVGFVY